MINRLTELVSIFLPTSCFYEQVLYWNLLIIGLIYLKICTRFWVNIAQIIEKYYTLKNWGGISSDEKEIQNLY